MINEELKKRIIAQAVKNLKEFGYQYCNEKNILHDDIYKAFFLYMLADNLGRSEQSDGVIEELIKELS